MFDALPRPLLFAHRGASLFAPENTLPAFDLAHRLGADILELDVHLSRDHEVVVIHDATLERTTNGRGAVNAHTYAELHKLDAGYHFRTGGGERLFRDKDTKVPKLDEVLRAFPNLGFNIEIKQEVPSAVPAVLDLLAQVGSEQVVLAAGNDQIMRELEAAKPGCALGLSVGQVKEVLRGAYLGGIPTRFTGRALQVPPRRGVLPVVTRRLVKKAKAAGLEVHVWTINDAVEAGRFLELGIDGLMTDDPGGLVGTVRDFRAGAPEVSSS